MHDRRKAGHRLEVVEVHGIADVLTRRLLERLEIPGLDFAPVKRRVDKTAPALAVADPGVQFSHIPTLSDLRAKIGDDSSACRIVREVVALARVAAQVEKLVGVDWRVDEFVCAAADHHHRRDRAFGEIFADRLVMSAGAAEMRRKAAPVDAQSRAIVHSRPRGRSVLA